TNEHLQLSFAAMSSSWKELFDYCTTNLRIPSQWKFTLIFLLFKGKGEKEDPNNYRGISLLSTSYKVFTKVLKSRLEQLLEEKLSDCQFGFRRGRSTSEAIAELLSSVKASFEDGKSMYGLFIDFEKAFDKVDRVKLLMKLKMKYQLDDG